MENKNSVPGKPGFLFFLGILGIFICSCGIFIHLIVLFGPDASAFLLKIPVIDVITDESQQGNALYLILKILLYGLCIFGLIIMLKLIRKGLIIFITAQALLLLLPFLFLGILGYDYLLIRLAISFVFIIFYLMLLSLYLKHLR